MWLEVLCHLASFLKSCGREVEAIERLDGALTCIDGESSSGRNTELRSLKARIPMLLGSMMRSQGNYSDAALLFRRSGEGIGPTLEDPSFSALAHRKKCPLLAMEAGAFAERNEFGEAISAWREYMAEWRLMRIAHQAVLSWGPAGAHQELLEFGIRLGRNGLPDEGREFLEYALEVCEPMEKHVPRLHGAFRDRVLAARLPFG